MLHTLHIENYALIKEMKINFSTNLVAITGETGAGKSIILGALSLLLGERANTSAIRDNKKKCIVEGTFNIVAYDMQSLFEELDLDYEDITIIRREITPTGKSRAFVNDTPVNLSVLKPLIGKLIDIHSQHKNMEMENESFQFQFIDTFANNKTLLKTYQTERKKLEKLQKEYLKLQNEQKEQNADFDYWKHQLSELQVTQIKENEVEELEQEQVLLNSISEIQKTLNNANDFFVAENSPIDTLRTLATNFSKLKEVHTSSSNFATRLESCYIELQDLAKEIYNEADTLSNNDISRLDSITERLNTLYSLQHKHGKSTNKELLVLQAELEQKIAKIENFDDDLSILANKTQQQKEKVTQLALQLRANREKVIPHISKKVATLLLQLGMPHAQIIIELLPTEEFRLWGKEQLRFLFSANKNIAPNDISKIASGGEVSRLMLTVKYMIATSTTLPTILFDEIDTGVSGDISDKMGEMMATMSKKMQVITITHQPQIVAKANQHWEVFKDNSSDQSMTQINELDTETSIQAIARMLSGSTVTQEALANAKSLKGI